MITKEMMIEETMEEAVVADSRISIPAYLYLTFKNKVRVFTIIRIVFASYFGLMKQLVVK